MYLLCVSNPALGAKSNKPLLLSPRMKQDHCHSVTTRRPFRLQMCRERSVLQCCVIRGRWWSMIDRNNRTSLSLSDRHATQPDTFRHFRHTKTFYSTRYQPEIKTRLISFGVPYHYRCTYGVKFGMVEWTEGGGPLLRAKFHPIGAKKTQNRHLSNLNTGALRCAQCCR